MVVSCQADNSVPFHYGKRLCSFTISRAYAGAEPLLRRLIILIYAGWVPQDLSSSRSCLCLRAGIRRTLSHRGDEDSPYVVLTPHRLWKVVTISCILPWNAMLRLWESLTLYQRVIGVLFAIAHMKAASSLAMAVTTVLRLFPRSMSRQNRAHSRTWHFQAMSLTS